MVVHIPIISYKDSLLLVDDHAHYNIGGGCFSICLIFIPMCGEMLQFDE